MVNEIKAGCELKVIAAYGGVLVGLAIIAMLAGWGAGVTCAKASTGFARNVRKDMFYRIQNFSFANIDRFSTSSLVTRLTTDVTNVQMAYMMLIRGAIRGPLNLIFSFVMAYIMGGSMAFIFLVTIPILGGGLYLIVRKATPHKSQTLSAALRTF